MKQKLTELVTNAALKLVAKKDLTKVDISIPQERYGDYSTNIALLLAPIIGKPVFDIASAIAESVKSDPIFEKVEPMKNGFINFTISLKYFHDLLRQIGRTDKKYGRTDWGKKRKVLVEFVSANPTGPLHIGHGRWAVIGDDIASLLEATGHRVDREFYVNDVGTQIDKLEKSVTSRINGTQIPEGGYGGEYVRIIADKLRNCRNGLRQKILRMMIDEQKAVLSSLGVKFDRFFYEHDLHKGNKVKDAIFALKMRGVTFEEDKALWFKSQEYGDDKNRVLVRDTGETTYFAADIAYHADKFKRKYDLLIDVWGADHHGYVPRLKAALKALGLPVENFEVIIGQLVALFRGTEQVRMSKRTGDMITLDEVVSEVGRDATRFFLTSTSVNSHLNFDPELAKKAASDNPVYYVQYAHARISNILSKSKIRPSHANLELLAHPTERKLMKKLLDLPDQVTAAAKKREPHVLVEYAKELSAIFHNFYHQCRVISDDKKLTEARLTLVNSTRIVLRNVLELLKVSAPERM